MQNDYRQKLHLEPDKGWLNDPNGLCWFNGAYHVYFQYAPDSPEGKGNKCWGHFESRDLLSWRFTGTVLFPDTPDDKNGVYSGCGFVKGGLLYLFYTGNVKHPGNHNYITSGREANVILVTTKDGVTMRGKKVLLRREDYPAYCSCHVRDPKVWEEDGRYRMALGARTLDGRGCVLYYTSADLEVWTYERTLLGDDGSYMWECPDEFVLGGRRYLSVSPQGIPHGEYEFQNVYSAGYFRIEEGKAAAYREWDKGFDFYAPQTFDAPDGRKIMIAWEGIGDIPYTNPTVALGRQHCLTIPRVLTPGKDGVILQNPVEELKQLRRDGVAVSGSGARRVKLPFEIEAGTESAFSFEIKDLLALCCRDGRVFLEFKNDAAGGGRTVRRAILGEPRDVRIIADASSIEVFLNGGETVMSSRAYPQKNEAEIAFSGICGMLYGLDGMRVIYEE